MPLKLAALIIPLCLDSFAVSAALGLSGLSARERLRLSLVMAAFEMAMPVIGFLAGTALGSTLGGAAEYVAVAILGAVGLYMLSGDDDEVAVGDLLKPRSGWVVLGLGLSVSLDELAIGFTIGLLSLPLVLVLCLIGAQAFVASQLGSLLGARLGRTLREHAEQVAGVILLALATALLIVKVVGRG
ncbi:MAG: manganese efflux pump MntP family protein [Candidatus Dormibacteria bacterium]